MERELEKDLKEIEYLIYAHKERENTHTQSVLERAHEIIETCAKAARTLSELEELLSRENTPEITRSPRDNDGWIPVQDKLPEDDVDVLITYADIDDEIYTDICITTYGYAYLGGNKLDFKEWRSPFEYFRSNYKVIAWQPLPEPYRSERSRENEK